MLKRITLPIAAMIAVPFVLLASPASATQPDKSAVCHPVNGKGELGNGWNPISPDKASSHIDDQGNGKHESKDGRTDVLAVDGACPAVVKPPKDDDEFEAYEVDACWQMDAPDGVEGTYEWPQTRVFGEACGAVPACGEVAEWQHDTYWIRDEADEKYLAGLTTLNSPADDAQLEPHDYYGTLVKGADCITVAPPTITQPTCDNPHYTINWVAKSDHWTGEVIVPPNSSAPNVVNVTATADEGYEIDGESYWELTNVPLADDACDTPSTTNPPTDTPTTETAALPDTGAQGWMVPAGLAALGALGAGVVLVRKAERA